MFRWIINGLINVWINMKMAGWLHVLIDGFNSGLMVRWIDKHICIFGLNMDK